MFKNISRPSLIVHEYGGGFTYCEASVGETLPTSEEIKLNYSGLEVSWQMAKIELKLVIFLYRIFQLEAERKFLHFEHPSHLNDFLRVCHDVENPSVVQNRRNKTQNL